LARKEAAAMRVIEAAVQAKYADGRRGEDEKGVWQE
jgi:hypothetical protein